MFIVCLRCVRSETESVRSERSTSDLLIALAFTREEAPPMGRLFDRLLDP